MSFRYALKPFVDHPEDYPQQVLYYDANVSIIMDKFPKSAVHLLVLPRNYKKTLIKPTDAFDDVTFKASLQEYIDRAIAIAEDMFYSQWKAKNQGEGCVNIKVMCHAVPSMNNLHIHVLTDDHYSPWLKNKKHFNSFQDPFGITFDRFPLDANDPIRNMAFAQEHLKAPLKWRNAHYQSRFARLKADVNGDFESKWERIQPHQV